MTIGRFFKESAVSTSKVEDNAKFGVGTLTPSKAKGLCAFTLFEAGTAYLKKERSRCFQNERHLVQKGFLNLFNLSHYTAI